MLEAPERNGNGFVSLDEISAHWRLAFIAAQDALVAISRCSGSLRFPVQELREFSGNLERERAATAVLLDDVAREEHVTLRHRLSAPRATRRMLGLPDSVLACVFDLDGVLTASADLHAAAWREAFDPLLAGRVEATGERFAPFMPFDPRTDYYGTCTPGRASTASVPSWPAAASGCPRVTTTTRREPRRCTGWPTGRTRRCSAVSSGRA